MIKIDESITAEDLSKNTELLFGLAASKIRLVERSWDKSRGTPVFTVNGVYTTRGWTEWTQGFQFGLPIYQFDATGEEEFLEMGRLNTAKYMASHVSHTGVHDHGFNNISTYGNLLRLMKEGKIPENDWEREFYQLALKVSGAVQAARWTELPGELGYVPSFNGPHSLFSDTIRSMRVLAVAHKLGHILMGENDRKISLLERLLKHSETTARYNVYFGEGRDGYDVRGRVVHESVFNINNGTYRCPSTQQGYSPFSTWTRGLSWILLGYAEQLEFIDTLDNSEIKELNLPYYKNKKEVQKRFLETAMAVSDFYIENTPTDGIPYWDTGAPGLAKMGDYLERPADPFNPYEPVDSSAAAISAQGLLRLGHYLKENGKKKEGDRYLRAGLTVSRTVLSDRYLSVDDNHQGLLLHSVYHHPNRWDNIREGQKVPNGESCFWGDYHAMELAVYLKRLTNNEPYLAFFNI
ncbi:MAG: glycosyl hydrolase [Spirochaetes bacterium]|nr:MAG: glycosyl hydrolase [Spirochaetota bacterium]